MRILLFFFGILIVVSSCNQRDKKTGEETEKQSKDTTTTTTDTSAKTEIQDLLPEEGLKYLDSIPEVKINTNKIMFASGKTYKDLTKKQKTGRNPASADDDPAGELSKLIATFTSKAIYLANDANYTYGDQGPNKPAQVGLAYNLSARDHSARKKMYDSCAYEVYGLDCSGFLYQVFQQSGVAGMNLTAKQQSEPARLTPIIAAVIPGIKAVNKLKLAVGDILSGDLIYWDNLKGTPASHIGIALRLSNTKIYVFQSNGSSSDCINNMKPGRGPRSFPLTDTYFFAATSNWNVIRFE